MTFSHSKKLTYSGTKCYSMTINGKKETPPELIIDPSKDTKVVRTNEIVYLGDIFNEKGDNDGLIKDRISRGVKAIISITSILIESNLGKYHIDVALLLYSCLFLATVLFNSQTWSNLRKKDHDQLRRMQSKLIKRLVGVPYSTCTAFTYLELGILPIECEIHIRQLSYLHRILNLEEDDPVFQMWKNMQVFSQCGEMNWWTGVSELLTKYELNLELHEIKAMSKECFKKLVQKCVRRHAFNELVNECNSKKKTGDIQYSSLKLEQYMENMYPTHSKVVFQCRSRTLDIKDHRSYKYADLKCRGCENADETLEHVINCNGKDGEHADELHIDFNCSEDWDDVVLSRCVHRIMKFLDENT